MWTDENRKRCDRSKLRYPSDLMAEGRALAVLCLASVCSTAGSTTRFSTG